MYDTAVGMGVECHCVHAKSVSFQKQVLTKSCILTTIMYCKKEVILTFGWILEILFSSMLICFPAIYLQVLYSFISILTST